MPRNDLDVTLVRTWRIKRDSHTRMLVFSVRTTSRRVWGSQLQSISIGFYIRDFSLWPPCTKLLFIKKKAPPYCSRATRYLCC